MFLDRIVLSFVLQVLGAAYRSQLVSPREHDGEANSIAEGTRSRAYLVVAKLRVVTSPCVSAAESRAASSVPHGGSPPGRGQGTQEPSRPRLVPRLVALAPYSWYCASLISTVGSCSYA